VDCDAQSLELLSATLLSTMPSRDKAQAKTVAGTWLKMYHGVNHRTLIRTAAHGAGDETHEWTTPERLLVGRPLIVFI
jgi:hypothetical protein